MYHSVGFPEPFMVFDQVTVTFRTSDASGQLYLEPEVSLEGWITSLPADMASEQQVMALYSDHATSEQFHSEFKTDLDLERLPSGKFDTKGSIPLLRTCQKRRLNTSKGECWSICLNVRFATRASSELS